MRKSLVVLALAGALAHDDRVTPAFAQARTDVKIGLVLEPPSLDPTAGGAAAADRRSRLRQRLRGPDPLRRRRQRACPALAKSWDISEDGLTYTFHLRRRRQVPRRHRLQRRRRQVLARPHQCRRLAQRPEGALCRHRLGRCGRSGDRQGDAEAAGRRPDLQPRLGRRGDRGAGDAPTTTRPTRSAPARSVFANGSRATASTLAKNPNYWGTPVKLEKRDLPVHRRPDRGVRRDAGRRRRRLPELSRRPRPWRSSRAIRASTWSSARPRARPSWR